MRDRESARAWKAVLTSAAQEARRRGDRRLGTDHLLLGLLSDDTSGVARTLGVSLADARAASEGLDIAALAAVGVEVGTMGEGAPTSPGGRLPPLSSGARAVLKRVAEQARARRRGRPAQAEFLAALLALDRPDPAAELLGALGVDRAAVRERLSRGAGGEVA